MRPFLIPCLLAFVMAIATASAANAVDLGNGLSAPLFQPGCGFSDEFATSSLNPGWRWIDPLGDSSYSLTENSGHLRLSTPDGGHDLYLNLDAPRMVQEVNANFTITTKVTIDPDFNYQGAGLLIWKDASNYVRIERTLVRGIDMWYRIGGNYQGIEIPLTTDTVHLRFERSGTSIVGSYSEDGFAWTNAHAISFPATGSLEVGLVLINQWQDNPINADFDYFRFEQCQPAPSDERILNVPVFKQANSPWGSNLYDYAFNQFLWCGSTIGSCGCATSSVAMVLSYHGVTRAGNGAPTNPGTVNDYFKRNSTCDASGCVSTGYWYGGVRWSAVAQYSTDARAAYGTPLVIWNGNGGHDPATIRSDIENDRPVVLNEPGHFVVATGYTGNTFIINDPAYDRERLDHPAYGNSSLGIQRFAKTSTDFSSLEVAVLAPAQVIITDPEGNESGYDLQSQDPKLEIPGSLAYFDEAITDDTGENPPPPPGAGINILSISTPRAGKYTVEVSSPPYEHYSFAVYASDIEAGLAFNLFEGQASEEGKQVYSFEYDPTAGQTPLTLVTPIDIKPETGQNTVNCRNSMEIISVAILTTPTFDATTVDHGTVRFSGVSENHVEKKTGEPRRHEEDVDGDGDIDLLLHFRLGDTLITCSTNQGSLTGETYDGQSIYGIDEIRIIERGGGDRWREP